jgi:hypothetical protein
MNFNAINLGDQRILVLGMEWPGHKKEHRHKSGK